MSADVCRDSVVMAISLDKVKGKEHIVIGEESCVYHRLNGNVDVEVLYTSVVS